MRGSVPWISFLSSCPPKRTLAARGFSFFFSRSRLRRSIFAANNRKKNPLAPKVSQAFLQATKLNWATTAITIYMHLFKLIGSWFSSTKQKELWSKRGSLVRLQQNSLHPSHSNFKLGRLLFLTCDSKSSDTLLGEERGWKKLSLEVLLKSKKPQKGLFGKSVPTILIADCSL